MDVSQEGKLLTTGQVKDVSLMSDAIHLCNDRILVCCGRVNESAVINYTEHRK